jgi:drug/metabolite transporter (DMT)-like permease
MFAGVTLVIFGAFHSGYGTSRPHAEAVFWGGISALAWGLSVVGTLVWEDFGIVSSIKWNSWFNFFAAGFAATAVSYSAK